MAKTAVQFEKMIHADRSRKKNEALAARIFGKDRRASAPIVAAAGGGSMATRAGVKKRASLSAVAPRAGNINTEWTHDLHQGGSGSGSGARRANGSTAAVAAPGSSLAGRISRPGEAPKTAKKGGVLAGGAGAAGRQQQQRRTAQVAHALSRTAATAAAPGGSGGLTIRGMAAAVNEPLVVMAQNFAPGTTAADIESAMTPVGGLVTRCRILKTTPLVIAEIVFESREGAQRVIETFNNQTADGRLLHVYPKDLNGAVAAVAAAGGSGVLTPHNSNTPAHPRPLAGRGKAAPAGAGQVVDGSLGFDDPMDTDGLAQQPAGRLYSDDLVGSRPPTGPSAGRRGRGRGGRR